MCAGDSKAGGSEPSKPFETDGPGAHMKLQDLEFIQLSLVYVMFLQCPYSFCAPLLPLEKECTFCYCGLDFCNFHFTRGL